MNLSWTDEAFEDYVYWQHTDMKVLKRINILINEIKRQPFYGIGAPERLKHNCSNYWSRRIDQEHRLVYKVTDSALFIAQCRYHY